MTEKIRISQRDYDILAAKHGQFFVLKNFEVGRDPGDCKHESVYPIIHPTGPLGSGVQAFVIIESCRICGIEKRGHEFTEFIYPGSCEPPW